VLKAPLRLFSHLTGIKGGGHVFRFVGEDVRALLGYLASPAARRAESAAAAAVESPADVFEFSRAHFGVGPVQNRTEITGLLELARENGTHIVCEIGAQDAGTSVMLSRVLHPELLVVMDLFVKNRWRLRADAPPGQTIATIDGDTTHPLTLRRLGRKLRGRKLDLLIIDGDHLWSGVRHDFLSYRQLVRDGGLIAFHDICPATDPQSPAWTGDVPAFWRTVSELYEHHELIDQEGQQGFGIGVLRYDQARAVTAVLSATQPPSQALA
jgi:hypothetical protein